MQSNKLNEIDSMSGTTSKAYTSSTEILDYEKSNIQNLVVSRDWMKLNQYKKIGAAYTFVRNEVLFGYNKSDDIKASQVLIDGYGQCNTKGNLLMALLRSLGVPCRFHGFTIDQKLQKGVIPGYIFLSLLKLSYIYLYYY